MNGPKELKRKLKFYMQTILETNYGQNCRQASCWKKVSIMASLLFRSRRFTIDDSIYIKY